MLRGLSQKLQDKLEVVESEGRIMVSPRSFIARNDWLEINDTLKAKGFNWVSAKDAQAKMGHWEGWERV